MKLWSPECWTEKGTPFFAPHVEVEGCPRAYITGESIELVQLWNRTRLAKDAIGATMFGSDLSRYPAKVVDAFTALELEKRAYDNARFEAERIESQR